MAYVNPSKFGGSPQKSWNSTTKDARLGFAMRDKRVTEANSTPMVVPKLGMSYQLAAIDADQYVPQVGSASYGAWSSPDAGDRTQGTVPGIMSLVFEPIFAQGGPNWIPTELRDIFTNVWTQMRIVNNMTKNFQAQDLQIVYCGLAEILCHVANLRRILNIGQKWINHELNQYYNGEMMCAALGFPISEAQMRFNWERWWRRVNVDIIDQLRRIKWLDIESLMPGLHRWEGLCSEIYKDTSENTDYCQLYVFKRESLWKLNSSYDAGQQVFLWQFEKFSIGSRDPQLDVPALLSEYIDHVVDSIRSLFWDEGTATILATINTIVERNMGDQIKAAYIDLPNIPWEGEDVPLTWDFDMMLAIHNATICNVNVYPPVQDVANERLTQAVYTTGSTATGDTRNVLITAAKVLNLPNFGVSTEDIINALQWCVTSRNSGAFGPADRMMLTDGAYGTDIITSAIVYQYFYNLDTRQATKVYRVFDSSFIDTSDTSPTALAVNYSKIVVYANFAFAPLLYLGSKIPDPTAKMAGYIIEDVLGQMEVQYIVPEPILRAQHEQFMRNFWGYPTAPAEIGTFNTSYDDRNSDRK